MKKLFFLLALFCFHANAQIVNIPDANFKAKLLAADTTNTIAQNLSYANIKIDSNNNGEIEISEATQVLYLNVSGASISSLSGITAFSNLLSLDCSYNLLQTFDSTGLSLRYFYCRFNQITSLNLNSSMNSLQNLNCSNNQLNSLDVNGFGNLIVLNCAFNQIASLDSSSLGRMLELDCNDNRLTSLNIKNGKPNGLRNFGNNPNLTYICADDVEVSGIQNRANNYGYNCNVNSYCSFTHGGTFYTVQGNSKYGNNNNDCDASVIFVPNLKINMAYGIHNTNVISDNSGNYSVKVAAGTYTLSPVLENPSYFNVSPASVDVTFAPQSVPVPVSQNFCISANGNHSDLKIIILPQISAIPGFDAGYRILYRNNGTDIQSGSVNLAFNDAVLDFVSANPGISNQISNNLSWDFTNLLPFETREIGFTLNVNSPTETPAVNMGDILNFTATIASVATDETPSNNIFTLNQTVSNSLDPNDKTCLEGKTLAPEKVGDYVHYMIRFENNGTANAQNIVVKDMIDTDKFDISSIVPIKASHSFTTRINETNKVEFIFENINLSFDDANNDGYVVFKIKTKPTLINGDTFSNSASIYFDYNFPIVTNTATTTIQALSTADFEFSNYFSVYPNPVSNVLNISVKETIKISSVAIYNTLGQLVLLIPNAENAKTIDVSNLTSGNYFIKINSDKGTANTKFIKN